MNPHNLYPHRCLCVHRLMLHEPQQCSRGRMGSIRYTWETSLDLRKLYLMGQMVHVPRQRWPLESETHKPLAYPYRTQNLRDCSSVTQQLNVKEQLESSNLSLRFPVPWAKPGGTTRHLSQEFSLTTKDHHNYKDDALWMISKLLSHLEVIRQKQTSWDNVKGLAWN